MKIENAIINIVIAIPVGIVRWLWRFVKWMTTQKENSDTFGRADWASLKDVKNAGLFGNGFIIGLWGKIMRYPRSGHMLVLSRTRGGKTTTIFIPNLLGNDNYDIVCIDPKGELERITGEHRRTLGKVLVLNPENPTDKIDPLAFLLNSKNLEGDVERIAQLCVPRFEKGETTHFSDVARNLVEGTLLYLWKRKPALAYLPALARKLAVENEETRNALFEEMREDKNDIIRASTAAYQRAGDRERGSFDTTLSRYLRPWTREGIREISYERQFTLDSLFEADKPFTMYVQIPPDNPSAYGHWARMMIGLTIATIYRRDELKRPILFLLDEADVLGYVPDIESAISKVAYKDVSLVMAFQSIDQIKANYPKAETIMQNCAVWSISALGNDMKTLKLISELIGTRTVNTKNESKADYGAGKRKSEGKGETGRPLIKPEELRELPLEKQVLLVDNMRAIMADKAYFKNVPELYRKLRQK